MYGKILSIKDSMIYKWFILAADEDKIALDLVKKRLEDQSINPMVIKRELARKVVKLYYDMETALKAENYFNTVVVDKGLPNDIPEISLKSEDLLINIIFNSGLLKSKSEARRMIKQGAVKLDDLLISDIQQKIKPKKNQILKIGKRRYLRII